MTTCALFANVENPFQNTRRAFRELAATVLHAEHLGFEQVWLTEHHFNAFSLSSALFPLLAHLAGITQRIAIGAGAALLPLHDPVRMAEDIATVDALSDGRLLLGVGRGGPFPDQFRHFHVAPEESRPRLFEALDLIGQALARDGLNFQGDYYRYDDLSVYPRPVRRKLPVWLASLSEDSIALAARQGYGLMAPSAAPLAKVAEADAAYRRLCAAARRPTSADFSAAVGESPANGEPLVIARYFYCHRDGRRAREEALPFIRDFGRNMRAAIAGAPARGETPLAFGQPAAAYDDDALLAKAIVGDFGECVARCEEIAASLGPHVLLLKPATYDPLACRRALTLFAERVRPALRDTPSIPFPLIAQGVQSCAMACPKR
jgi:alkanesulfonate monooxygenase SsuD/methylene tetrahydromethanopterin reductase-like flavin-dependent oxidoreductase (luciferase family)